MKPAYSVIIPYLETVNGQPNPCIDMCVNFLEKNSSYPIEIVKVTGFDYYNGINHGVERATSDVIVTFNDDMFVPPNWDVLPMKYVLEDEFNMVSARFIESGRIPVGGGAIEKDFGRSPQTFDYEAFVKYVKELEDTNAFPEVVNDGLHACPVFITKKNWVPFRPNEFDYDYFYHYLPSLGFKMKKVSSYVYHIQSFSTKPNL